jgi:putative addiction module component (TIGR02574 family)
MGRKLEDLAQEAMELAPESRAALAKRLLDSLESPDPEEHERLWVEESARRYDDLRAGRARAIPAEEVFAKLAVRSRG